MSSKANWLGKYMVNEQAFEREIDIQRRVDRNYAFLGDVREGFVTSLFLADRWGGRDGLNDFLKTDWSTKLGDTFDALHEHYLVKDGDEYHLKMPKDYEELERVARLFRETYIAYFIWWCIKDVDDGIEPTIWHALADYVEEAHWLPDRYEFWNTSEQDAPDKFLAKLWDGFFDRVYGRSRKFNFSNFVAANSMLCMLEERYYREKSDKENKEYYENNAENAAKEKANYEKTAQEVEDFLNGKN